jgi:hypothetical protein
MRMLAALMLSMLLLTTAAFTRALVTAQQQRPAQPTPVAGVVTNR